MTDILTSLKSIDAPKSLMLVSEGLAMPYGDDGSTSSSLAAVGSLAAAARTSIYGLRLDDQMFASANTARAIGSGDDARIGANGLEQLVSAARGALFTVTGAGEAAFERINSELSGYYLLGLETSPADRGRTSSTLRVEVARKGVTVRAPTRMFAPNADDTSARSPQVAAATALATPLPLFGLSLRVASFSFQGPDSSKVQLLIHADIGHAYGAAQDVAVAYLITDASGRVVDSKSRSGRLPPSLGGIPSPLLFVAGAALTPGDYMLKLAAAEGGNVGSVEHPIHASLVEAGVLSLSDLTVGGPIPSGGELTRPSVDYTVRFGVVHAYLEAYGAGAANAKVRFEISPDGQSPPVVAQEASPRSVNQSPVLFSTLLQAVALPPGRYRLRAIVTAADQPDTTMSRPFEVPEPTTASTPGSSATSVPGAVLNKSPELFLPTESSELALPFHVTDALRSDTLEVFQSRVPAAVAGRFIEGIEYLRRGEYMAAETSFKAAIQPDVDFTAALAYLGVCLAASGHDADAAGAWQTALIRGSDLADIHSWLGNALLRTRDVARARYVLERAANRWPADTRFAWSLAMLNATTGQGLDAFQMLQRYLVANAADPDALYLGVQWLYQIHANGRAVRDRTADLALARSYAADYARVNGPKQPLVKQWLDYLSKAEP